MVTKLVRLLERWLDKRQARRAYQVQRQRAMMRSCETQAMLALQRQARLRFWQELQRDAQD